MNDIRDSGYLESHVSEFHLSDEIAIVANRLITPTAEEFHFRCGSLIRAALDEVIDMPRSGRFSLDQLEKTEKTYVGTKVEILFRHEFGFPKGERLDLLISGIEVDVKNTVGSNWTIPTEAVGEICILLRSDDSKSRFSAGLLRCSLENLNKGQNQDKKRTIAERGRERILWLIKDGDLSVNFFLQMDSETRSYILEAAGKERIARLFLENVGTPIKREIIKMAAQQEDYMKRVRVNGGARDIVEPLGFEILYGYFKDQKERAASLGCEDLGKQEFICLKAD